MQYKLKKIAGDASFREFYRIQKGNISSVIILAKKDKFRNLTTYSAINEILDKNGILAPKLLSDFTNENIIEVTDFGKISFYDFIKNKKNKFKHYKKLIDLIIKIQKINLKKEYKFKKIKIKFDKYHINNLKAESNLFFDWYLKYLFTIKKNKKIENKIRKELDRLYKKLYFRNRYFTHRDFHASNIMIFRGKPGLIDSQDAIIGNPLYDVVSLIDDVRIKISQQTKDRLFNYYLTRTKFEKKNQKMILIFCQFREI